MAERIERYRKGLWAEVKAALYLSLKLFRIKARRFKTKYGEIDLIAVKKRMIVFVEVKARDGYTAGVEAVSPASRSRIEKAAQYFILQNPKYAAYSWRFDAIVVIPGHLPYHLPDAWRPS